MKLIRLEGTECPVWVNPSNITCVTTKYDDNGKPVSGVTVIWLVGGADDSIDVKGAPGEIVEMVIE